MVLTHSWQFVCVLPLGLLCLVFRFLFIPCFTRHRLLLAIFGLRNLAGFDIGDPLFKL